MLALFLTICLIGILVMIIGSIIFLVAAFRESVWWGLGCMFLAPVSIVFTIIRWPQAKKGFLTNLAGLGIVLVAALIGHSTLGERLNDRLGAVSALRNGDTSRAANTSAAEDLVMKELGKREEELRARKASIAGDDIPALTKLRADVLQYNEDLKNATTHAEAAVAQSKIASAIGGDLVQLRDGILQPFEAANLAPVRYYAVYFSAEWCPPCRAFSPQLVEWYKKNKAANPNFELIFVSRDKSPADMKHYMTMDAMPWPAVSFEKIRSTPLAHYCGRGIPDLVFIDGDGKVLSDSFSWGTYRGPQVVLAEIGQTLAKNR